MFGVSRGMPVPGGVRQAHMWDGDAATLRDHLQWYARSAKTAGLTDKQCINSPPNYFRDLTCRDGFLAETPFEGIKSWSELSMYLKNRYPDLADLEILTEARCVLVAVSSHRRHCRPWSATLSGDVSSSTSVGSALSGQD